MHKYEDNINKFQPLISDALNYDIILQPMISEKSKPKYGLIRAILDAKTLSYHTEHINDEYVSKDTQVKRIKNALYNDFTNNIYYNLLGGALINSPLTYNILHESLIDKKNDIKYGLLEYISDYLCVDIHIIYSRKKSIKYHRYGKKESPYFHKNRDSILVFFYHDVYYLVLAQITDSAFDAYFTYDSEIIEDVKLI